MSNREPQMPRPMQKALADLCRFGALNRFGPNQWAARSEHCPEGAHDDRAVQAIVSDGFAERAADVVRKLPSADAANRNNFVLRGAAA